MNKQIEVIDTQNCINEINPPQKEYWLASLDEEFFRQQSIKEDKYYIHILRLLGYKNYKIVAKNIEFLFKTECESIKKKQIAQNESQEWFYYQLLQFLSKDFDNNLNKLSSQFYQFTFDETLTQIRSFSEIASLYSQIDISTNKLILRISKQYENFIDTIEQEEYSYFKAIKPFLFSISSGKINTIFEHIGIDNPDNIGIKTKLNHVLILLVEDILKRRLFYQIEEEKNIFKQQQIELTKIVQNEILSPHPNELFVRVMCMRYIFEEIEVDYEKNKAKVLKLLYFLFYDCKGQNIYNFYIQDIYEIGYIPCSECKNSYIRDGILEKLKLLGNENIVSKICNNNFCCKKVIISQFDSRNELSLDVSQISKDNTQPISALIFYYLFRALDLDTEVNRINKTEFVIRITNVVNNAKRITDTNMYKYLKKPWGSENRIAINNVKEAQKYLSGIGLKRIEKEIEKDLKKLNNGLLE